MNPKLPILKGPGTFVESRSRSDRGGASLLKWLFVACFAVICGVFGMAGSDSPADLPADTPTSAEAPSPPTRKPQGEGAVPWHQNPKVDATPQERLASAIWALQTRRAVSARIRQKVDLFGKQLIGSGAYLEQRQEPVTLLKLEFKLQLGQKTSSLMQVCDGKYLWTYRKLLDSGKLSRLDAVRATEALKEAASGKETGKTGANDVVEMLPGLGGLPQLLRGLHSTFDFVVAETGTLESKSGQMDVCRLKGKWKKEQLARLLPGQKEAIEAGEAVDLTKLPEHLPDQVVLFLGQQDRFPYRIEYRRQLPDDSERSGEPISREIVTMEWLDVVIDRPVDPRRFEYNPTGLQYDDTTKEFLKRLKEDK